MATMQRELGNLYNDHMNEAHTGEARYTARERYDRVRDLLARGALTTGIDLYHAGLVMRDLGGLDVMREVYELFVRAAELGYPGARHSAALEYDLWLRAQGWPQQFGSFWRWEGDDPVLEPPADQAAIAARRAAWGLPTLAEEAAKRRDMRAKAAGARRSAGAGEGR